MRRVLVAALLLAGIICLGQQPRAQLGMMGIGAGGFGVAAPSGSAWGDHGTLVNITTTTIPNDTAAPNSGSFSTVRGTQAYSTGKHYFEIKVLTAGLSFMIPGLIDSHTATGAPMDGFKLEDSIQHYSANGTAESNDTAVGGGFTGVDIGSGWTLADNDIMGIAYDATNGFHYLSLNNVWFLSGDPTSGATGTGHVGAYANPISLYPGLTVVVDGLYQLKTASFTYTPPTGYSAWNFLLKRDVYPGAANDNTPLGLNQVA